jgi:hypothetical protein
MAHTCNPNLSGGRDQDNYDFKLSWVKGLWDPILKKTLHKKGLVEWLREYNLSSRLSSAEKKNLQEHTNKKHNY